MQVIAGKARRLLLATVPGIATRPTSGQIKETLFNILQPYTQGSYFLDLYAGSGGIGIEALSRGAREAVFVDNARAAVRCIKQNLEHTRLAEQAQVFETDAVTAVRRLGARGRKFDIIFLDPPYDEKLEMPTLTAITEAGILAPDGMIIVEARKENDLSAAAELGLVITREKVYKNNKHVFLNTEVLS